MPVVRSVRCGAVLALLAAACSESVDLPDAGPPTLELGTGDRTFEPLEDGDTLYIVQGPQAGYHFFGSMRATNIFGGDPFDLSAEGNPQTTFEAFVGDMRVDAMASSYRQGLRPTENGLEMVGRAVILDIEDDSELAGAEVLFRVSVVDARGIMLSDERVVIAQPHPNNL